MADPFTTVTPPELPALAQTDGSELVAVWRNGRLAKMPQRDLRGTKTFSGASTPPYDPSRLFTMQVSLNDRWRNTSTRDEYKLTSLSPITWEFDGNVGGADGAKGEPGAGISPKGQFATASDLPSTGSPGDLYVATADDTAQPPAFVAGDGAMYVTTGGTFGPSNRYQNIGPFRGPQGEPGSGTSVSRVAALPIPANRNVVDLGNGQCAPADPTNAAHRGKLLGFVSTSVAQGATATILTYGPAANVSGAFSANDTLFIALNGGLTNVPPSAPTYVWRQVVAKASTSSDIVYAPGEASVIQDAATALVLPAGGFASQATQDETAAGTVSGKWIDPASLRAALLGLRNKTVNVRRYASLAGAFADLGDGFTLDIPAGNYQAVGTGGLPIGNKSISIRGEGAGTSRFYFPAGSQGLVIQENSYFQGILVEGLSLHSQGVNTGTALKIVRPSALSGIQAGPRLMDLDVLGDDPSVHGWSVGVDLTYCWNTLIDRLQYQGIDNQTTSTAVWIRGQSTPVTMRTCNIVWANRAVYAEPGAYNEGFVAESCQIVAVNDAYVFSDPNNANQPGQSAPLVQIIGGHSATFRTGLSTIRRNSVKVVGHEFYKRPDSTTNWTGVTLALSSDGSTVSDCGFFGYRGIASGTATAVTIQGSIGCAVQGCSVSDCDVGLAPVDTALLAYGNRSHNTPTWASNTPTGSQIAAPFTF